MRTKTAGETPAVPGGAVPSDSVSLPGAVDKPNGAGQVAAIAFGVSGVSPAPGAGSTVHVASVSPGTAGVSPAPGDCGAGGFDPGSCHAQPWRSRGYLPHFDQTGYLQMMTFRLADSLPASVLAGLDEELKEKPSARRQQRLEAWLDAGHGACYLRDPRVARLVEAALLHFDGVRYHLLAWVIMPNHAHALIETAPGYPLAGVVHSWKSFSAHAANQILGQSGVFWWREYFDRVIRDERHLRSAIAYIHNNPCKAGLVTSADQWPFSSVRLSRDEFGIPSRRDAGGPGTAAGTAGISPAPSCGG